MGKENNAYQLPKQDETLLDYNDPNFRALRFLVDISKDKIEGIAQQSIQNPLQVQLVDFVGQIGLSHEVVEQIRRAQEAAIPEERKPYLQKYDKVVGQIHSIPVELSRARVNPFTQFEHHPPLLFGMGGGSKALNKGLPIDVLSMILTAEKLRRELNLGRCRIICANGITYTNIPKNPDFSKEGIDRVLTAERDLLRLAVERFGLGDHWDIFLETDIERIIGSDLKQAYDRMIDDANTESFIGGHHYSIEMAQMWSLLNQEHGGVKLGWFMRNLNKVKAEYIMDEQPFDARYVMYLASRGITNKTSIPYVKAGVRILPGTPGQVDKAAPYICYDPNDRVLLSPFEDPEAKLSEATQAGLGLQSKYIRSHFGTIIKLFQEIVLGKDLLPDHDQSFVHKIRQIDDELLEDDERFTHSEQSHSSRVGKRLQYILDYIFEGNRPYAEKLYREAFRQVR